MEPDWIVLGFELPQYCPIIGDPGEPPFLTVTESQAQVAWGSISKSLKVSCRRKKKKKKGKNEVL